MRLCCVREKLRDIADYWQCLETKPLQSIVIGVTIFDMIWSTFLLLPTTIAEFLYVNFGGRAGFVDAKWANHVDVYKFRRFHDWEVENGVVLDVIDWTDERLYINETRVILDEKCSIYENKVAIPGDPGDYLKEVAGHPVSSGYNARVSLVIRLWTWSIFMVYFTTPAILLAVWWRRRRSQILAVYIVLQCVPMILLVTVCIEASSHLLCAINVIYNGHPVTLYFIFFTVIFCIYQVLKVLLVELYVVEMYLISKRKEYGFRRGYRKTSNRVAPALGPDKAEVDVETLVDNEKQMFNRITGDKENDQSLKTGQMLAREILELGDTADEEATSSGQGEQALKQQMKRAKKSILVHHKNRKEMKNLRASFASILSTSSGKSNA